MKEIIFINNIKERLFDLLPQKDFDSIQKSNIWSINYLEKYINGVPLISLKELI